MVVRKTSFVVLEVLGHAPLKFSRLKSSFNLFLNLKMRVPGYMALVNPAMVCIFKDYLVASGHSSNTLNGINNEPCRVNRSDAGLGSKGLGPSTKISLTHAFLRDCLLISWQLWIIYQTCLSVLKLGENRV